MMDEIREISAVLKKIEEECRLRGYSKKTISSYVHHTKKLLESGYEPREYLLRMIGKGLADETVRQCGFALKFYMKVCNIAGVLDIPNVKRGVMLPVVLSRQEIDEMIATTMNLMHRLIILTLYGTGMRASELINLRWEDVDFKRKIIHIHRAKGKKDRIVMLSPKISKGLKMLRNPEGYVFGSRFGKYTLRSIEAIVKNASLAAGIKKKVTPHTLRHSFATHLLEKGTDIRYIKELLGHSEFRTTLIYTKVSNKDIIKIKSPLD